MVDMLSSRNQAHYGISFGLMFSALLVHFYIRKLSKKAGFRIDRKSGHVYQRKVGGTLFSIGAMHWPIILLALGVTSLIYFVLIDWRFL